MADNFFDDTQTPDTEDFFSEDPSVIAPKLSEPFSNRMAAMLSLVKGEGRPDVTFSKIREEMLSRGDLSAWDSFKTEFFTGETELNKEAIDLVLRDPIKSPQHKADFVKFTVDNMETLVGAPDLTKAFLDQQLNAATIATLSDQRHNETLINNQEQLNVANRKIQGLAKGIDEKTDLLKPGIVADVAELLATPGYGFRLNSLLEDSIPGLIDELGNKNRLIPGIPNMTEVSAGLLPGEVLKLWSEKMRTGTPAFRIEAADRLAKALDQHSGLIQDENELEAWGQMIQTIGSLNATDGEIEINRWINNIAGASDVFLLGDYIRGARFAWRQMKPGSLGRMLADTNPAGARHIFSEAMAEKGEFIPKAAPVSARETAATNVTGAVQPGRELSTRGPITDALGTTKEEIAATSILPKTTMDDIKAGPDINSEIQQLGDELFDTVGSSGLNFRPVEKQAAADRVSLQIQEMADANPVVHISKSVVETAPDGKTLFVKVAVGATPDRGFNTLAEARFAAESFEEVSDRGFAVSFRERQFDTSNLVPVPKGRGEDEPGEYYAYIDQQVRPTEVDVDKIEKGEVFGVTGKPAKFLDPASRLDKFILNASSRAVEKQSALGNAFARVLSPFSKLGSKRQSSILEAIAKTEGDRWMGFEELMREFNGDSKSVRGYKAIRDHEDLLWVVNNKKQRRDLFDQKYKWLEHPDYDNLIKPLTEDAAKAQIINYFDPSLKQIIRVDSTEIESVYKNGDSFGFLRSYEQVGTDQTDYVLISARHGSKIAKLPLGVIRYTPGYVTNIHEATHIVKKIRANTTRNGTLVPGDLANNLKAGEHAQTYETAINKVEALRRIRELNLNAKEGERFIVVEARELRDTRYADQQDFEAFKDAGRLFFSRRSTTVKHVSGKRKLVNIQDAILRASQSTARHIAIDEYSKTIRQRWVNTYGQFSTTGLAPNDISQMVARPKNVEQQETWKEAVSVMEYYNLVEGADPSYTATMVKEAAIWIADKLAGDSIGPYSLANRMLENASTVALKVAKNPMGGINLLKSIAFIDYLALNPARQFYMQASQATLYAGLDGGFRYMVRGGKEGLAWQQSALVSGLLSVDHPRVWQAIAPKAAKGLGMTTSEYKQFILNFRRSGLDNVSSNEYAAIMTLDPRATVAGESRNPILQKAMQAGVSGRRLAAAAIRIARDVGFGAGEMAQIQTSYLVSMNRFLTQNPEHTIKSIQSHPEILDEIAADARRYSFGMNRAGATIQTKGALSGWLQFTSHQQKALQFMIPRSFESKLLKPLSPALEKTIGKLGSATINNDEKLRMAYTQLLVSGTTGLGLYGVFRDGVDEAEIVVPDTADDIIRGGLQDLSANYLARLITGEEGDFQLSSDFSPLSGAPTGNPLVKLIETIMSTDGDILRSLPPGITAATGLAQAFDTALDYFSATDLPVGDKLFLAVDEMARQLPVYNNFMVGRFALRTQQFATKGGRPITSASTQEAIARMLVGAKSASQQEISDIIFDPDNFGRAPEDAETELRQIAKDSYRFFKTISFRLGKGEIDRIELQRLLRNDGYILKLGLNETELATVNRLKWEAFWTDRNEAGEVLMAKEMARSMQLGFMDNPEKLITSIKNMEDFKDKDELILLLQGMLDLSNRIESEL